MALIINLLGAPCAGKTTAAHGIMYHLKKAGVACAYVPEYASELVLNEDDNILACQDIIYGEQLRRLRLAAKHYDVVVTDGPLILTSFYDRKYQASIDHSPLFADLVKQVHNSFDNYNVFFNRVHPYDATGRYQTDAESKAIEDELKLFLSRNGIQCAPATCNDTMIGVLATTIQNILKDK